MRNRTVFAEQSFNHHGIGAASIWIFTSLGRPDLIRRVVDTYAWGHHSPVALVLYEQDPRLQEYLDQEWPESWSIEIVDMKGNGPTYNEIFRRYPTEPQYGFLADDAILKTPDMLFELETEAADRFVAYSNDQHHGETIATMPCIGGELVRRVGYLAPKNIIHWGIDCVWHEIGRRLDRLRYRPDLVYEHLHPLWNSGEWDKTYRQAQRASLFYTEFFRSWQVNELPRLIGN